MSKGIHISYLRQEEIDKQKWDACISNADNGLVYPYSFYLDAMAANWDALVLNDYQSVMPLTWKKKFGFHYLYQPAFTASLGVFGKQLSEELVIQFIQAIPIKFKFIDIALNYGNIFSMPSNWISTRNNYILSLNKDYESLFSAYKENIRRNIKRAKLVGCIIKKDIPISEVIALAKPNLQQLTNFNDSDYTNFETVYQHLYPQGKATTYGVYSPNQELVASCAYFFSHKRAYYILVGNHPNGKTMGASHYMIDQFISDHAGQDLVLDFEGSDIRNLAYFYSSFGAGLEIYPYLKINRLPFWIRWVKN